MTSRRVLKAAQAIREVVGMAILTDLKDPRIQNATVTYVEVTPDMREARVHVSVMDDESQQKLTITGLQNSAGYLQHRIAKRLDTRYTPRLRFELDMGVKRSIEVEQILNAVLPPDSPSPKLPSGEFDTGGVSESEAADGRSEAATPLDERSSASQT